MRRSPLVIILMTVFIALIGFGIVIPLIPLYGERYGASGTEVGLLVMVYSLMQFLLAPWAGRLSDKIGRRPVLIIALILTSASYLLFAFANSLTMLFVSRILAGIGGADITVSQAYIADVTPPEKRARGMGLFGAAFGVGFVLGPALTGITSPLGEWVPALIAALLAGGTAVFAIFFLPEPSDHEPSLRSKDRGRFRVSRPVITVSGIYFVSTYAISLYQSMLVLFTFHLFGWGASQNGLFIAMFALIGAIIQGGFIGKISAWMGERNMVRIGLILAGVGLFLSGNSGPLRTDSGEILLPTLATWLSSNGILELLFIGTIIYALGNALVLPALSSLISRRAPVGRQGQALGFYQSSGSLGRIFGPATGGLLFDHAGIAAPVIVGGIVALMTGLATLPLLSGQQWKLTGQVEVGVEATEAADGGEA